MAVGWTITPAFSWSCPHNYVEPCPYGCIFPELGSSTWHEGGLTATNYKPEGDNSETPSA